MTMTTTMTITINLTLSGQGGGGAERVPAAERISFLFKQYLLVRNVATFTKIYWRSRFRKMFLSWVSLVANPTTCLVKF